MIKEKKVGFDMSLWSRIKAASSFWWAIVVNKELVCLDDTVTTCLVCESFEECYADKLEKEAKGCASFKIE